MKTDATASWARTRSRSSQIESWSSIRDELTQEQSRGPRLLELQEWTHFGEATDPRDKVYSLMSMMKEEDQSAIPVNYSGNYTTANLYLDIATHCLASPDGDKLLGWAGLRPNHILSGLPSWAPDWSTRTQYP